MKNLIFLADNFTPSFKKLIECDLPIKVSYKLYKISEDLTSAKQCYDELYKKILLKYCLKHEVDDTDVPPKFLKGNPVTVDLGNGKFQYNFPKEVIEDFNKDLNELLMCDFEVCEKLTVAELGDKVNLSGKDLAILEWLFSDLIKEREEKNKKEETIKE